MRSCESTTTITQNDACMLQRYAHQEVGRITNRWMLGIFAVMVAICCFAAYQESDREAIEMAIVFACLMALYYGIFTLCFKHVVAQMHPWGDQTWTHTTWIEDDGIHRLDEDGDEYVYPLRKLRFAYRDGTTLLLATINQAVIPINLMQLSETDRKLVFELLKEKCPKLVALE